MLFGLLHLDVQHHKGAGQNILYGAKRGFLWKGFTVDLGKCQLFDLVNFSVENTLNIDCSLQAFKVVLLVLFCDSF
jgi:hypothetical protein